MDQYLGEIRAVSFPFAPRGWLLCYGQTLPIAQNQALFSLLGTEFGGDGISNFKLPDLRGRTPMGQGVGNMIGTSSGTETQTMTIAQLPQHTHMIQASAGAGTASDPTGQVWGSVSDSSGTTNMAFSTDTPNVSMAPAALTPAGNSQPIPITQPLTVINYIIATSGIYPSRG